MFVKLNGDNNVVFDEQFFNVEDIAAVNEWALTFVSMRVAHNDVDLHAKMRREITAHTPIEIWFHRGY